MVNSDNPSNNCVPLRSHYSHCKASLEQQPPSKQPAAGNFFRKDFWQPQLRRVDTPLGLPEPSLPTGGRISGNRCPMRRHVHISPPPLFLTSRGVRAGGFFSDRRISSPESPAADLQAYVPSFMIQHLHHPLLSIFLSDDIYFQLLLDFSSKSDTSIASLTIWSCFVPSERVLIPLIL